MKVWEQGSAARLALFFLPMKPDVMSDYIPHGGCWIVTRAIAARPFQRVHIVAEGCGKNVPGIYRQARIHVVGKGQVLG